MNFNSIKEYFYKTYSYCFLLMLIPVCVFGLVHFRWIFSNVQPVFSEINQELTIGVLFSAHLFILTIVHWYSKLRLKKASKEFGLGKKLDEYFMITMLRVTLGLINCFIVIAAYLFTQFELLNAVFFLILIWMILQIPSSKKVCKELKLKGDEKEMVLFKKDRF